ncbi:MAG: flagellar M-ring protein FliF [Deltaproteobacteria bacterium]|nr:flagellar M-ring protein FliF [Deltaproteobacteria bacterium]
MKAFIEQFLAAFQTMPTSKKLTMVVTLGLVVAGFVVMFLWVNQVDYGALYTGLSPEDAGKIVSKLKEQRIPYKFTAGGSSLLVPSEQVHELRLTLASDGLPAGGNVGFEIFDQANFSTTEFVQKLNYQRALQGELERTLSGFREVERARVLLVIPEESLFVEDSKSPSASVSLKLRSSLASDKVAGVVHIVASAVEGLSINQVTVVDTTGRVLFKGADQADQAALSASTKLDYQRQIEAKVAGRVQSMLEGIVGKGKAIVRVSADIELDRIDLSEVEYNPDSKVIRSEQRSSETARGGSAGASGVRLENTNQGTVPVQGGIKGEGQSQKQDEVINYEINRTTKHTTKPSGAIKRLSVAAVVDGRYEVITAKDDSQTKKYIPRNQEELDEFEKLVKKAMGFSEDREDQIYMSSIAFSVSDIPSFEEKEGVDWLAMAREYSKPLLNTMLVLLVFMFVVRPLVKSVRQAGTAVNVQGRKELSDGGQGSERSGLPEPKLDPRARTMQLARENSKKTEEVLRGWLNEER